MKTLSTFEALEIFLKGDLSPADVGIGDEKKKKPPVKMDGLVVKSDSEKRLVYGWASIVEKGGEPVIDHQGDVIHPNELVRAAHGFIKSGRAAKVMHKGKQVGEIVESLVMTADIQKALGIDLGLVGWFIGMHVPDDGAWDAVQKGLLKSFSIGGRGTRVEV